MVFIKSAINFINNKNNFHMNFKNHLTEIAVCFSLYWIFVAPLYFIPDLKSGPLTFYLFLPAGVKLFSILVFKWRGLVGTALGTFTRLTYTDPTQPLISWLIVSVSATFAIYLVVELGLRLMRVERDLSNLKYLQIVLLALVASIINGYVFAYGVSALTIGQMSADLFHSGFLTVMGNFAGNAAFVCLLMLALKQKTVIADFINRLQK